MPGSMISYAWLDGDFKIIFGTSEYNYVIYQFLFEPANPQAKYDSNFSFESPALNRGNRRTCLSTLPPATSYHTLSSLEKRARTQVKLNRLLCSTVKNGEVNLLLKC